MPYNFPMSRSRPSGYCNSGVWHDRLKPSFPGHFGHGERTAHYALLLAERLGPTKEQRLNYTMRHCCMTSDS